MTIDEAIAHEKIVSEPCSILCMNTTNRNDCIECRAYHKQLAEWLEELKALRNGLKIKCDSLNEALEKGKKVGYSKALDDCLKIVEWDGYTLDIKRRIEKLKVGD